MKKELARDKISKIMDDLNEVIQSVKWSEEELSDLNDAYDSLERVQ